ncbi:acyl-CoA carboxylase subunit epsilon [Nocardioides aquiterrae]|uniref:Acyl-CoA carboxylase subunit epsilon n=1 Tax=Nocardioides aquiterrae TaxID=203799 RepID=A0ABN1UGX7_9ACTN
MTAEENADTQPFLRIIRGDATPEEVAAVVAVLSSLQAAPAAKPRRRPEWSHYRRAQRVTPRRGPGGWRASGLPG